MNFDFEIADSDVDAFCITENLFFDETRYNLIKSLGTIDIQACPGSGKTTLIASKLILLSKKWKYKYKGICVLSHTNVAKDEIINRIKNSKTPEARRLLSYPHFIGTIQEFVNRFLGIPFLRSRNISINLIDTEQCIELIYSKLNRRTKTYIDNKSTHSNVLYDFNLFFRDGKLDVKVPTFPNGSNSDSYKDLKRTRYKLIKEGYLFYRDLYIFSDNLILKMNSIKELLQKRFPLVLIDEMQDTQKYQDSLIQKIFPPTSNLTSVQRFGDPDQAIFNGINDEVANESYNEKPVEEIDFVINESYRFDGSICEKIKGLSLNEINMTSATPKLNSKPMNFQHTILVFNDETINEVIPYFSNIITNQFDPDRLNAPDFIAKAIGAVGKDIDPDKKNELKIGQYADYYNKNSKSIEPTSKYFIEDIYRIRKNRSGDIADNYKTLINCILKLLRLAGATDDENKYFNHSTLRDKLTQEKTWRRFRVVCFWLINSPNQIPNSKWNRLCRLFCKILTIELSNNLIKDYLDYGETIPETPKLDVLSNTFELDHFKIKLSTIHGVKGETHDATLILETKNYNFDIHAMLAYLTGEKPNENNPNNLLKLSPTNVKNIDKMPNRRFMKQLYVGMSRPRHLLCLAIHNERISDQQKAKLEKIGWHIQKIKAGQAG